MLRLRRSIAEGSVCVPDARFQTWMTCRSSSRGKSWSWVTTGTSEAMAVAAIQESLIGIFCPLSRRATRSFAHAAATSLSIGIGSSASAATSVDRRRSRVLVVLAASTPARSSPKVMTETASCSGNRLHLQRPSRFSGR